MSAPSYYIDHDRGSFLRSRVHKGYIATFQESATEADKALIVAAPELLDACQLQHQALDILMALCVQFVPGFMPTKSPSWDAVVAGKDAIAKANRSAS